MSENYRSSGTKNPKHEQIKSYTMQIKYELRDYFRFWMGKETYGKHLYL